MECDAIDYNSTQAITHTERPVISQTEWSTKYHILYDEISYSQQPALQYPSQHALQHLPDQQSLQHIEPSEISHIGYQYLQ